MNQPDIATPSRRRFMVASTLAAAGFVFGCSRQTPAAPVDRPSLGLPPTVTLVEFANDGKRLRTIVVPKLSRSESQWRRQLSPAAFEVTRRNGTERAYSGALLNVHDQGVFRCLCCDTALFDAATKFESGTGWPSFWQPIAHENVHEHEDRTFGMVRTAVSCTRCDAHLGHVFDDGPRPTGLRYCMNSVAMKFARAA